MRTKARCRRLTTGSRAHVDSSLSWSCNSIDSVRKIKAARLFGHRRIAIRHQHDTRNGPGSKMMSVGSVSVKEGHGAELEPSLGSLPAGRRSALCRNTERRRIESSRVDLEPRFSVRYLVHQRKHRVPQIHCRVDEHAPLCGATSVFGKRIAQRKAAVRGQGTRHPKRRSPSRHAFCTRPERVQCDETSAHASQVSRWRRKCYAHSATSEYSQGSPLQRA